MSAYEANPQNYVVYGPDTNCTLALCPAEASVYQYRPSLAVNTLFLVLFGLALIIHASLGLKYRTWAFATAMILGCVTEIIGYGGRIYLWQNPFSFDGFLMQIICITLGPAFFSAAIYLTLSRIIIYLGPEHARFSPKLYYWLFIPCDILSLVVQSIGGALSSISSGGSKTAVDVAIAGLSFQVFTLAVFIALAAEYAFRYSKAEGPGSKLPPRFKIFVLFLSAAIILILTRCAYRIDELKDGYGGSLIHDQGLFIGLEGVMIILACYSLMISHPGPIFGWPDATKDDIESRKETGDIESKQDVGDIESKKETGDIESKQDVGDIESKKETGDIESKQDVGDIESKKETGDIESKQDVGDIESKKDTGDIESKNETGNVGSKQETGDVESKQGTGAIELKKETGAIELKKETNALATSREEA